MLVQRLLETNPTITMQAARDPKLAPPRIAYNDDIFNRGSVALLQTPHPCAAAHATPVGDDRDTLHYVTRTATAKNVPRTAIAAAFSHGYGDLPS